MRKEIYPNLKQWNPPSMVTVERQSNFGCGLFAVIVLGMAVFTVLVFMGIIG